MELVVGLMLLVGALLLEANTAGVVLTAVSVVVGCVGVVLFFWGAL